MALNIRSTEVNRLAQRLAERRRITKTEAVRQALESELERETGKLSLRERLEPICERIAAYPKTGHEADKAYFDEINGEF